MKLRHYIPIGFCLTVLIADLSQPGYGNFGLQNATKPVIETATRAIARVEDYTPFVGVAKVPGCSSNPTEGYTGFTATQWEAFKKMAKSEKDLDKAVKVLGGKLCDVADGFIVVPSFAHGKQVKIQKGKNGKLNHKVI